MRNEIAERQERTRKVVLNKDLSALILSKPENIQYLTGVMEPSIHACSVLIVSQQTQPELIVMWLDKQAAQKQAKEIDIQAYTPESQMAVITKTLDRLGVTKGTIGMDERALAILGNSLKRSLPHEFVDASNVVEELRMVKSEEEIRLLQKACEISDEGMRTVLESLKPGVTELQIAAHAEHQMITEGSDRMKHRTIVASGSRTNLVHPWATHKKITNGELVAIDLGAVYHGYCSDVARSTVVGKSNDELKNVFDVLLGAQDEVLHRLRPGVSIQEIEAVAREFTGVAGCRLIGHVGHSIGLNVEEYPFLRSTNPYPYGRSVTHPDIIRFEKNMVVAFFQSYIQSKQKFGIRLEDTVVITSSGAKMMTTYPRELFS